MKSCARLEVESQPFSLFSPVRAAVCLSQLAPSPPLKQFLQNKSFFFIPCTLSCSSHAQVKEGAAGCRKSVNVRAFFRVLALSPSAHQQTPHVTFLFRPSLIFSSLCTGGWSVCQAASSHIYSMHSSFSVLCSSSQVLLCMCP